MTPSSVMLPQPGQGEHLEAAAVGEHGAVPAHEPVQAAHGLHHLVPGAQVEVVGVGQLHLAADLLQIQGGHRPLDGPLGAHIHEHRGLHRAVGAGEHPPPRLSFGLNQLKHGMLSYIRGSARRRISQNRRCGMRRPHRPFIFSKNIRFLPASQEIAVNFPPGGKKRAAAQAAAPVSSILRPAPSPRGGTRSPSRRKPCRFPGSASTDSRR